MRNGAESPESQHPPDDGNGGGRHTHFSHFSLDKTGKSSISGKAGPKIRSAGSTSPKKAAGCQNKMQFQILANLIKLNRRYPQNAG
jgi:hypothetical protein